MSKVISFRLSDAEEGRLRGAAAMVGVSTSNYLKWLITNGRMGGKSETEIILSRLDEIATTLANTGAPKNREAMSLNMAVPRTTIVKRLRERGLPSSTIRQVEATLDELEGKTTSARQPS